MCNNNCCMCCQCDNTHDEDTPQEITYTSVCDSDACKNKCKCCCCNNGICEDDASLMVLGLSEKMEECCDEVHKTLDSIACQIEELDDKIDGEIERSTLKDDVHDQKNEEQDGRLNTLEYNESLDFNRVVYVTRDESQDHKAYIEFYHNENYMGRISAEPFLKDGILDSVDLESDGHTLHFVWNTDAGKQDSHVDLNALVLPISRDLLTEITNRTDADTAINTNITNLKNSITGYNPELGYDGTAVTVGQIDGKQFKVHMATFPELVSTVSPDYANNRFSVTTNKGNTNYIELKNSTYETKVDAANHYTDASINDHTITLTRQSGANPTTIVLPDNNTDTLVKQKNCIDDAAIPVLLAYSANPTTNTAAEAFYSAVTINPHTTIINGIADKAIKDDDGHNIADTYVSGGSFNNSNRNLTLVNPAGTTLATINIPDADANKYVTGGSVSNNQLTLTYNDNTTAPAIDLSSIVVTDNDHYVTSGTLDGNTLKLTRQGVNGTVDVDLSSLATDNDHYVTSGTLNGTTLKLTRQGVAGTVDVDLSGIAGISTDNDHYSTSGTYSDSAKKITISGNSGFSSFDIDLSALVARIEALEGLWEINPNDSTQLVAKSSRSAKAAGFYDSTVS